MSWITPSTRCLDCSGTQMIDRVFHFLLVTVSGFEKSEIARRIDALHRRYRRPLVLLDLPPQLAGAILQLPACALERAVDRKCQIRMPLVVLPDAPVVGTEVQIDAAAKEALATAMQKDFNDEVREESARALGILKARDQVPVLIAALQDPQNREHSSVRVQIAHTLGVIRDPAAGPALEKTLREKNK